MRALLRSVDLVVEERRRIAEHVISHGLWLFSGERHRDHYSPSCYPSDRIACLQPRDCFLDVRNARAVSYQSDLRVKEKED